VSSCFYFIVKFKFRALYIYRKITKPYAHVTSEHAHVTTAHDHVTTFSEYGYGPLDATEI